MLTSSKVDSSVSLVKSHNWMELSRLAVASTVPSRLNARLQTVIEWPVSSASKWPCAKSQIRTFLSAPPDAIKRPSIEKHSAETVPCHPQKKATKERKKKINEFPFHDKTTNQRLSSSFFTFLKQYASNASLSVNQPTKHSSTSSISMISDAESWWVQCSLV